ncbi:MAG: hypothetical protein JXL81_03325, partial [Deltaproteobacteria bacterium]|nr:hypothetical protein [Deltaproteobacteria bacterium]
GGCVSSGPAYFPRSLETTPITKLVTVKIPETEKIVMIDGKKTVSAPIIYVSPGKHTYTFRIDYTSPIYCNGPSYGLKADRDYRVENGEVSSVVFMKADYSMDVTANEGQTIEFKFKPEPECKASLEDYFKVVVSK